MPLVYIDIMEGRPEEKVEKMIGAVSEAIASSLEAPLETVRVVVNEMKPHQYGVAGKPWTTVLEERRQEKERQS
ncbi:MAG: 2-hydroxymuconate tautomerase [Actinomycetota bacterium]|nr:2-hydroxymuconate tautomerase [Actinomycetota bacterium]